MGSHRMLLLLSSLVLVKYCSAEFVPVFMWGTQSPSDPVPALQKTSENTFKDEITKKLSTFPIVVVFAEQSLSPEDFGKRDRSGNVAFPHLSKTRKTSKTNYLSAVQSPIKALRHASDDVAEMSIDELNRFGIPESKMVIVDLNDAAENEQRFDMLKRHDGLITSVYDNLVKKYDNVLAIYTAHHASWIGSGEVHTRRVRAVPVNVTNKYFDNSTILFYTAANVNVTFTSDKSYKTFAVDYSASATNTSGIVVLNGTGTTDNVEFVVSFTFNKTTTGYWYMKEANLSSGSVSASINQGNLSIYAGTSFSYACGDQTFKTPNFTAVFSAFQVQPVYKATYNTKNMKFDDPYHCVGFTTIPIWSGLFVTFILLLIMTLGLTMMMDIKTMDRFDDAKGKTITINTSE